MQLMHARWMYVGPQRYNNTHLMIDAATKKEVFRGYAGDNGGAHHPNPAYYGKKTVEGSIFGKELKHLKTVCWLRTFVVVEHLPASYDKLDITIHHVYGSGFHMNGVYLKVEGAP